MRKSPSLNVKLFNNMDMNEVLRCMRRSMSSVENCAGVNRMISSDMERDAENMLRLLKLFSNGDVWATLAHQQEQEIGWLWGGSASSKVALEEQDDPALLEAAKELRLYSGTQVPYREQLESLDRLETAAEDKYYNFKALAAAFIVQMNFRSVVNEKKAAVPPPPSDSRTTLEVPKSQPQPTKATTAVPGSFFAFNQGANNKSSQAEITRTDVPLNVCFDSAGFIDRDFVRHGYSGQCVWLRAKDIPPAVLSVRT